MSWRYTLHAAHRVSRAIKEYPAGDSVLKRRRAYAVSHLVVSSNGSYEDGLKRIILGVFEKDEVAYERIARFVRQLPKCGIRGLAMLTPFERGLIAHLVAD